MGELCTDNRFELIEKYKKKLIEATNIESRKCEMALLDDILFRFWQMGWLDRLEMTPRIEMLQDDTLMVQADEGQFEKVGRMILSYQTWCKIFYQDGDDTDKLCGTEINEMYLDISGDGTVVEVLKGGDTDED